MKIKNTVHKCNDVIFVSKSRYAENKKDRRRNPRKTVTTEKQREINRRMTEKKLLMLLQLYFGVCGLHLVLSYKNEPESKERARKEIENFLRRLRYWYSKYGYELKYIQVTEYENKRLHHHLIINGIKEISVSDIQDKIWKNGFVRCTPFEKDGYYNELAAYLIKDTSKTFNTTERVFGKRYTSSRNLQLPEPTEEIKQGTESDITDIPLTYTFEGKEYELIKGSEYIGINDYTGLVYAEYAMREIKPPPGRKTQDRNQLRI